MIPSMILSMALLVHRAALHTERQHPPCGEFITVDGVRLHYLKRGSGSPMVLLHGNGGMIADYQASGLVEGLARTHRVIVFDRPGYGHSSRPRDRVWTPQAQAALLAEAFRRLGIDRPVLVAHSWGALVAVALALDHPKEASGLVLLSGYYYPTPRLDVALFSALALPVIGAVFHRIVIPLLGWLLMPRILRKLFGPALVPARFRSEFALAMALRPWQIRASASETALMTPAVRQFQHRYAELTLPLAIVSGDQDRIVPLRDHSLRLGRCLACEVQIIAGAGHMVHHAAPDAIIAAATRLGQLQMT